jgi:hypothetical protein
MAVKPCEQQPTCAWFTSTDPAKRARAISLCHRCKIMLACRREILATMLPNDCVAGGIDFTTTKPNGQRAVGRTPEPGETR